MSNYVKVRVDCHNHRPTSPLINLRPINIASTGKNSLFVQNALVIGLVKSYETRLKKFLSSNKFNGNLEVIEAVDGSLLPKVEEGIPLNQGDLGCLLSHIKALQYAKSKNWNCVMIFEDDAVFVPDFNEKLTICMNELPANWDMLWLGGSDYRMPYPYSKNLNRLVASWGTFGYVIRDTVYDYFINIMSEQKLSSDDYFRRNHSKFLSFKTVERLVNHSGGVSDRQTVNVLARKLTIA